MSSNVESTLGSPNGIRTLFRSSTRYFTVVCGAEAIALTLRFATADKSKLTVMAQHILVCLACVLFVGRCCFAIGPTVYTPTSSLLANAFVGANETWFSYPEASRGSNYTMPTVTARPRFGIAVSGGGLRAATLGLGWLRGLHQVNVP